MLKIFLTFVIIIVFLQYVAILIYVYDKVELIFKNDYLIQENFHQSFMQKLSRPFELLSDAVATFFERAVLAQFVLDVPHLNVVYVVVH